MEKSWLDHLCFIVVAPFDGFWGRGATVDEALANMPGNAKEYKVYLCHVDSWVDDIGYITTPKDKPALQIASTIKPRKRQKMRAAEF